MSDDRANHMQLTCLIRRVERVGFHKMAAKRLKDIVSHIVPSDSHSTEMQLPTFDELPHFKNFSGCAWDVWGPTDQLGTVNLLTDEVVQRAAKEEVKYVFCLEIHLIPCF